MCRVPWVYSASQCLEPSPSSSKLPDVGISIFAVMTRLANEHGAINLSQGFPDFDCDPALVDAVRAAMRAGHNQYAPMPGVLALREAIAAKVERLLRRRRSTRQTEIQVTSGATAGLYATLTAFVQPGDEVLLFEPCYDSYVPVIRLSGGTPVFVEPALSGLLASTGTRSSRAITPRTRAILVNTPHNPTGVDVDGRRHAAARRARRRHRHPDHCRRSLRAHHLRRPPARKHAALPGPARARVRDQLVRQDLPHHRLEGRLLRRRRSRSSPKCSACISS